MWKNKIKNWSIKLKNWVFTISSKLHEIPKFTITIEEYEQANKKWWFNVNSNIRKLVIEKVFALQLHKMYKFQANIDMTNQKNRILFYHEPIIWRFYNYTTDELITLYSLCNTSEEKNTLAKKQETK